MIQIDNITLRQGDCLNLMCEIPDKSVDMILCDLPYGTTQNKWDSIIPLNDYIEIDGKCINKDSFYLNQFMKGINKKEIDLLWNKNKKEGPIRSGISPSVTPVFRLIEANHFLADTVCRHRYFPASLARQVH